MVSESGLRYELLGYDTADSQVDLDRLADPKKPRAGILYPPLHTRNRKVKVCAAPVRPHLFFRSRVPFPLSPLSPPPTISPVTPPEAGSSRNAPRFRRK